MKKILVFAMCALTLIAFTACDNGTNGPEQKSLVIDSFTDSDDQYFTDAYYGWGDSAAKEITVTDGKLVVTSADSFLNFWMNGPKNSFGLVDGGSYQIKVTATPSSADSLNFSIQLYDGGAEIGKSIRSCGITGLTAEQENEIVVDFTFENNDFTGTYTVNDGEAQTITLSGDAFVDPEVVYGQFVIWGDGTISSFSYKGV